MSESKHTRFLDALVEELQTMSDTDALEGENAESLVKLGNEILQEARYTARRIGPTEPDDTMVICPVCTSQFRAIPLDVQRQLAFLRELCAADSITASLLAALKEARQYVMLYSPSGRFDYPKETIDHIDAAIARAEGRSDE